MLQRTAFRLGMILVAVAAATSVKADDAFNPAVTVDAAEVVNQKLTYGATSTRKWRPILQPITFENQRLQEAMERSADRTAAYIHLLGTRPPFVALESNPINIQICALYAQKRARLFRHYRSLIDLTDLGDRRIVKQLASWLRQSARSEGADFVAIWCDDALATHEEPQARTIVASALSLVVDMLKDDGADTLMVGELQEYLRHL